jgi:DNA-directed RNA polymerase specialized sigma24 family protein
VNRRPARSESTNAFRSTRRDQDHQEAAGGGGSPSESRQNLVEITLGQIGYRGEQCADAAQDILAKRGDRALEWTVKQIEDIRRDPAVKNVAGVLAKRLSLGLHDPANDPPPSARDHDAGAGIRGENMQQLREQQQADPVYQARKIRGLLSDGRQPQEVADICGVPVSEVYAVTHGSAQKPAPSVQRSGIEGVLELVKQRPSAAQAATA